MYWWRMTCIGGKRVFPSSMSPLNLQFVNKNKDACVTICLETPGRQVCNHIENVCFSSYSSFQYVYIHFLDVAPIFEDINN